MTNNQLKCNINYGKTAMRASDDEQIIDYEWTKDIIEIIALVISNKHKCVCVQSPNMFTKQQFI